MNLHIFYIICLLSAVYSADYYDLLGISKDADNREIRKAFKKLALKLHPDKIQGKEENAHDQFIAINRAYEVLKDENTRKKYDLYGEEGLKEDFGNSWKGNYKSWNYYSESFGIYDDDPEIVTLNKFDFDQSVLDSQVLWFVNFYSPQCSHCHHLASAWRELARELQDIIKVGAVNCEEDWMLCRQQNIHSYPSLILYPQREKYYGSREAESMVEYILQLLPNKVIKLNSQNFMDTVSNTDRFNKPWIIFTCHDTKNCLDKIELKKLSVILENVVNVAITSNYDPNICEKVSCHSPVSFYWKLNPNGQNDKFENVDFSDFDLSTVVRNIFEILPDPEEISEDTFKIITDSNNVNSNYTPSLLQFTKNNSRSSTIDCDLKRLRALLPEVLLGYFDCDKYPRTCSSLYIKKFPTFILFKEGGTYEFYHGRIAIYDVIRFVKEAILSQVQTLTPDDFPKVIESEESWFIDFFAPWCPPCMELMPQWRKVSQSVDHAVNFGTVDCSTHTTLCRKYNINSYPTAIFYNHSMPHKYSGSHSHDQIKDFIQDILHPTVVQLSPALFQSLVQSKKEEDIWVVDFFAPWCGPCQQLAPQWRKLAKMLRDISFIHVGEINCQVHNSMCDAMGIDSFPTIRLYPKDSTDSKKFFTFMGRSRDAGSLQGWIFEFLPSSVESLTSTSFQNMLSDDKPWVVNFFAPWCSHCRTFAPEFEKIAQEVGSKVKIGKVNCVQFPGLCSMAGIRAYPTLKFYEGSKGFSKQSPLGLEMEAHTYEGVHSFLDYRLELNNNWKELPRDEL